MKLPEGTTIALLWWKGFSWTAFRTAEFRSSIREHTNTRLRTDSPD